MADDPRSEFERIFGSTQRVGETKSPEDAAVRGATQKLPGDSDVLGIRTDSDRFLLKHVPERLPIDTAKDAASQVPKSDPLKETNADAGKSSQDAMTIALNVNVFANLAEGKVGDVKSASGVSADGPTFVIPLPKPPSKSTPEVTPAATAATDARAASRSQTQAEFTRILHVQDTVTVPKPTQATTGEAAQRLTVPEQKIQPFAQAQPSVSTSSGPSDFTKVVKGSELRAIQERLAASGNPSANAPQWQPGSVPVMPQYVPAQNAGWPAPPATEHGNASTHSQSKLSQYMPLIIALNVLFILAILLIVFFAVKK